MRKFAALLTVMGLMGSLLIAYPTAAEELNNLSPSKVLARSNEDMEKLYGLLNYYPESTNKGRYRSDLIQRRINQFQSDPENFKFFEIVYGSDHGNLLDGGIYEYSGYTVTHDHFPADGVPWYAGWSGTQIQDFNLIKQPWKRSDVRSLYGISDNMFNEFRISHSALSDENREALRHYLPDGTFEQSIIDGLNINYAGITYREFMYRNQNAHLADKVVYEANGKPKNGDWIDYVHVKVPPTYLSWGLGTVFIQGSDGRITYLNIPIAPFAVQADDIGAVFEQLPSGAPAGEEVIVSVRVRSTFKEDHAPAFKWSIMHKGTNQSLTASEHGLRFWGHADAGEGEMTIPANSERVLYASFVMPDGDVEIAFEVNKDGTAPEETYTVNNSIDSGSSIKVVKPMPPTIGRFDLDYNILTRTVEFPLANGNITATLNLPRGSWNGNATGSLNVHNGAPGLFRNFQVRNNPPVNEANSTITRNPSIRTLLQRTDFGDDPAGKDWLNGSDPLSPRVRDGSIAFSGSVARPYRYTYQICDSDEDGLLSCDNHTGYGTTSASFPNGTNTQTIRAFVYNGRPTIAPKTFKNQIDGNTTSSLRKKLFWTGEPYDIDVIRWMYHMDGGGNYYDGTRVDGQYERTFRQQNSGNLGWSTVNTMAEDYAQSRLTASDRDYRSSKYDKAVFASDVDFKNVDYPIKSGYYFNPTGTYTFTIETVHYKPTTADTQEHRELADAVIRSFRYQSDLMYINGDQEAVNLQNERLAKKGSGYERKAAALTADDPTGVDGMVLLNVLDRSDDPSRYTKKAEELQHSDAPSGYTHAYWKEILEGYSESGTSASKDQYKYREYVKAGQRMYRITETTTVTIEVNPLNLPVYTHAQMVDGAYTVKAWVADIPLSSFSHAYRSLGTLHGISTLDEIEVTVQGSMYDDIN